MPIPVIEFKKNYVKKVKREGRVPSIRGELVPLVGLSRQRLYDYLYGRIKYPQWRVYFRVADWLGCDIRELVVNLDEFDLETIMATAERGGGK